MVTKKDNRPLLVKVGNHLINPNDVRNISRVKVTMDDDFERKPLYIVKFISDPNPEYPIWIRGEENIKKLTKHFRIE